MKLKTLWEKISNLGVEPIMPIYLQKSLIIMNQLCVIGTPVVIFMGGVLFFGYKIFIVGVVLWSNLLLLMLTLFLNAKGYITHSRFLFSTIPALTLTIASAFAKQQGNSNTLFFYLNPRIGIMIIYALSLFFLGFDKYRKMFWGISTPLFCFVFFDFIHQLFGVDIAQLPYIANEYPSFLISTSILLIVVSLGRFFVQKINTLYELKIQDQKNEIEDLYKDVRDSINYAKRIQTAMLPRVEDIQKALPETFILFKPRDIVSGDFYFFAEKQDKIVIACADCTGHGVPGAFMSMIGNEILTNIVEVQGITRPDLILNDLHRSIRNALKQGETENRDGMDVAVVTIERGTKITYAGAMNPLYYIHNGELREIKADKKPIGGIQEESERIFTKHEIQLTIDNEQLPIEQPSETSNYLKQSQTVIYLCSDGFQDQFGGAQGKKFMVKRFRELLFSIHHLPMQEQKQILDGTIGKWMAEGNERQIDDILVVGVRV